VERKSETKFGKGKKAEKEKDKLERPKPERWKTLARTRTFTPRTNLPSFDTFSSFMSNRKTNLCASDEISEISGEPGNFIPEIFSKRIFESQTVRIRAPMTKSRTLLGIVSSAPVKILKKRNEHRLSSERPQSRSSDQKRSSVNGEETVVIELEDTESVEVAAFSASLTSEVGLGTQGMSSSTGGGSPVNMSPLLSPNTSVRGTPEWEREEGENMEQWLEGGSSVKGIFRPSRKVEVKKKNILKKAMRKEKN